MTSSSPQVSPQVERRAPPRLVQPQKSNIPRIQQSAAFEGSHAQSRLVTVSHSKKNLFSTTGRLPEDGGCGKAQPQRPALPTNVEPYMNVPLHALRITNHFVTWLCCSNHCRLGRLWSAEHCLGSPVPTNPAIHSSTNPRPSWSNPVQPIRWSAPVLGRSNVQPNGSQRTIQPSLPRRSFSEDGSNLVQVTSQTSSLC